MQTDMWYDLVLLELTGIDPLGERLREAEAVQMASEEPEVMKPEAAKDEELTS